VTRDPRFHCGRDAQGLVDAAEVVEREEQRDRVNVVLDFF
jgi:hypothetical protein